MCIRAKEAQVLEEKFARLSVMFLCGFLLQVGGRRILSWLCRWQVAVCIDFQVSPATTRSIVNRLLCKKEEKRTFFELFSAS